VSSSCSASAEENRAPGARPPGRRRRQVLHEDYHGQTGIDLNRAGTPLLEIVTEPDMRSSAEAVAYAKALHALVVWLGICDGNMQEGSFRCDANVSVRKPGAPWARGARSRT
jgi:Asp-tRNA(Asn)/Glu-tRNA(Gln) amidotransferase B subunit